ARDLSIDGDRPKASDRDIVAFRKWKSAVVAIDGIPRGNLKTTPSAIGRPRWGRIVHVVLAHAVEREAMSAHICPADQNRKRRSLICVATGAPGREIDRHII